MRKWVWAKMEDGDFSDIAVRFCDDEYRVYSYADGDGIWGLTYSYDDILELEYLFGKKAIDKFFVQAENVLVKVPIEYITKRGYSVLKNGTPIIISEQDLGHMACESVITLPDGSQVEPDGDGSPLISAGFI